MKLFRVLAACVICFFANMAFSQEQPDMPAPPRISASDSHDVDVLSGTPSISANDLSIGAGELSLSHTITSYAGSFRSYIDSFASIFNIDATNLRPEDGYYFVSLGGERTELGWRDAMGNYNNGEPGTKYETVDANTFRVTRKDGTVWLVDKRITIYGVPWEGMPIGSVTSVEYPNGYKKTIHYKTITLGTQQLSRIQSVTTNTGLQFKYSYAVNSINTNSTRDVKVQWRYPNQIHAINNAYEYCNPTADTCSVNLPWAHVRYNWPLDSDTKSKETIFSINESNGRVTKYRQNYFSLDGIVKIVGVSKPESDGAEAETYHYELYYICAEMFSCSVMKTALHQVIKNGVGRQYEPLGPPGVGYTNNTFSFRAEDGLSEDTYRQRFDVTIFSNPNTSEGFQQILEINQPRGVKIFPTMGRYQKVDRVINPDGQTTSYGYDSRSNVTEVRQQAPMLPDIVTTAGFPETCSNYKTCNSPMWVKSPNAQGTSVQTDFVYHQQSGQLEKKTLPAAENGVRPETRYVYEQRRAWYKNASGAYVAGEPIWLKVRESFCKLGAANASGVGCVLGASDEVITEYDYGVDNGPNNLWLRGVVNKADGKTLRTCYSYDRYGNKISETEPKAGLTSCAQ